MSSNPFALFDIEMPRSYKDKIAIFCATGSINRSKVRAPFQRQIDFWYAAFLIAVKQRLEPEKIGDTYKFIQGSILSTNPWRIAHIQAVYLSVTHDIAGLADARRVFDFAACMANAGIPLLIQLLEADDDEPLWAYLDEAEDVLRN